MGAEMVPTTLLEREHALLREHADLVEDACGLVEGLERAGCPGHVTELAALAAGAAMAGHSAGEWRSWVMDALDQPGQRLLDTTEACMRTSGLWPWSR